MKQNCMNYCLFVQGLDRSIASRIESVFAEFPWVLELFGVGDSWLETRVIIIISSHP